MEIPVQGETHDGYDISRGFFLPDGVAILAGVCEPDLAWSQTPGAIPDPSTCQRSRRLQEQCDQQQQQFRSPQPTTTCK